MINGIGAPEGTSDLSYRAAEGIYLDDNVHNTEVIGNTVANCPNGGLFIHNARNFDVQDNTFFNNGRQMWMLDDNKGESITGANIYNNIFCAMYPNQRAVYARIKQSSMNQVGDFDFNYYARPSDDTYTMSTDLNASSSNYNVNYHTLEEWKNLFGIDQNSKKSPITIPANLVESNVGVNQLPSSNEAQFGSDISCSQPNGNCQTNWIVEPTSQKSVLEVSHNARSEVSLPLGNLSGNKFYTAQFELTSQKASGMEVFVQTEQSKRTVSNTEAILVDENKSGYELIFDINASSEPLQLVLISEQDTMQYTLENLFFGEVTVTSALVENYFRFEYNPQEQDTTIQLDKQYVDIRGNRYNSGASLQLQPFESVILLEDNRSQIIDDLAIPTTSIQELNECHIAVSWDFPGDQPDSVALLRSIDGEFFQPIQIFRANLDDTLSSGTYIDQSPNIYTTNYYKVVGYINGESVSSSPLERTLDCAARKTKVAGLFPNPILASAKELNVRFFAESEKVQISISDQLGNLMHQTAFQGHTGWNEFILPVQLHTGWYFVGIQNGPNQQVLPLIVKGL